MSFWVCNRCGCEFGSGEKFHDRLMCLSCWDWMKTREHAKNYNGGLSPEAVGKFLQEFERTHNKEEGTMLDQLRAYQAESNRIDFDGLVGLLAFGKIMLSTYQENELEPPEWLKDNVAGIGGEIKSRARDQIEKQLKSAKARLETQKSLEEKRKDTADEVARLEAALQKAKG